MPIMILMVEILLIINRYKMENLKTKWKLPEKAKKSPQPTGNWLRGNWKHSENSRIYSVFSQKNCPLPCQIPENGRKSGHQVGKTALKWLDNTVKPRPKIGWRNRHFLTVQQRKKPVTSFLSQAYGADEGIWTHTLLRELEPESSASASSATSAYSFRREPWPWRRVLL